MATAKKTPAKKIVVTKAPAKKVAVKAPTKKAPVKAVKRPVKAEKASEPTYSMSREVKDWIDRASSTMKHQANQIATLKEEVQQLKNYKKFAVNKIQGMSFE
jgi:polyhydroxyalkanoate synthesis regulator phasin